MPEKTEAAKKSGYSIIWIWFAFTMGLAMGGGAGKSSLEDAVQQARLQGMAEQRQIDERGQNAQTVPVMCGGENTCISVPFPRPL